MFSGRTINCTVHTALQRPAEDFFSSFPGLDGGVSANPPGQVAAVCQGFHRPDSSCMGGSQCGNGQKPDWSRTDDRYCFARADRRQAERMYGNRERLGQSRFVERHPGRDGKKVGDRQVDQFPEKARMMRVAQKAYVRAHVVVPAQTGLAVIAIKCGLKRPAVARSESSD